MKKSDVIGFLSSPLLNECGEQLLKELYFFAPIKIGYGGHVSIEGSNSYPGIGLRRPGGPFHGMPLSHRTSCIRQLVAKGWVRYDNDDDEESSSLRLYDAGLEAARALMVCDQCGQLQKAFLIETNYRNLNVNMSDRVITFMCAHEEQKWREDHRPPSFGARFSTECRIMKVFDNPSEVNGGESVVDQVALNRYEAHNTRQSKIREKKKQAALEQEKKKEELRVKRIEEFVDSDVVQHIRARVEEERRLFKDGITKNWRGEIWVSLLDQATSYGSLSPKQIAFVERDMARNRSVKLTVGEKLEVCDAKVIKSYVGENYGRYNSDAFVKITAVTDDGVEVIFKATRFTKLAETLGLEFDRDNGLEVHNVPEVVSFVGTIKWVDPIGGRAVLTRCKKL